MVVRLSEVTSQGTYLIKIELEGPSVLNAKGSRDEHHATRAFSFSQLDRQAVHDLLTHARALCKA